MDLNARISQLIIDLQYPALAGLDLDLSQLPAADIVRDFVRDVTQEVIDYDKARVEQLRAMGVE